MRQSVSRGNWRKKKTLDLQKENLRLAEIYWKSTVDTDNQQTICEMLVDGHITVVEVVKEINANIEIK